MFGLASKRKWGTAEMMVPAFKNILKIDNLWIIDYLGNKFTLKKASSYGVEEPTPFLFNEAGVKFLGNSGLRYLRALYNMICYILNNQGDYDLEGDMLRASTLTLNHRTIKTVKLLLSNRIRYLVSQGGQETLEASPPEDEKSAEEEEDEPSSSMSKDGFTRDFEIVYCSLPTDDIVFVNCSSPLSFGDTVVSPDSKKINIFLDNNEEALDCIRKYPNYSLVYMGVQWIPSCSRHEMCTRCVSWKNVGIDTSKLTAPPLEERPFIFKDWVVDGNYVVSEKVAARVLAVHQQLGRDINVCAVSEDAVVQKSVQTFKSIVPHPSYSYAFRDQLVTGYSKYISVDYGALHSWRESEWDWGKMKVIQYSFTRIPGEAEGKGVIYQKTEGKTYHWFYAAQPGHLLVRGSQTGYKKIFVYKDSVLELGPNWRFCKESELKDHRLR